MIESPKDFVLKVNDVKMLYYYYIRIEQWDTIHYHFLFRDKENQGPIKSFHYWISYLEGKKTKTLATNPVYVSDELEILNFLSMLNFLVGKAKKEGVEVKTALKNLSKLSTEEIINWLKEIFPYNKIEIIRF